MVHMPSDRTLSDTETETERDKTGLEVATTNYWDALRYLQARIDQHSDATSRMVQARQGFVEATGILMKEQAEVKEAADLAHHYVSEQINEPQPPTAMPNAMPTGHY